jgi:hypothetical protein
MVGQELVASLGVSVRGAREELIRVGRCGCHE